MRIQSEADRAAGRWLAWSAVLVGVLVVAGCGAPGSAAGSRVTVFAAASLTEAFTGLAEDFEAAHTGVEVVLNFWTARGRVPNTWRGEPIARSRITRECASPVCSAAAPT